MKLRQHEDNFELLVTEKELDALHTGLAETLEALDDWEFLTRTGLERHEMQAILVSLRQAREALENGQPQTND